MTIAVRPATKADAATISALNTDVQGLHAAARPERFKPPGPAVFPPDEVEALLAKPDHRVLLATIDGAPAGYVYLELVRRDETSATHALALTYIHHISVRPEFRLQGIGRALIEAARATGREAGIPNLALDVWSFNDTARDFFHRCGLEPYNVRMWDVGR